MSSYFLKFRIKHFPDALPAHRFRYEVTKTGHVLTVSEGYPSFNHASRAVKSLWAGIVNQVAQTIGVTQAWSLPPVPWHRDTYKPKKSA